MSYANFRLWVIILFQCRFISCNKFTTVMGNMDNGGHMDGDRDIWKISELSLHFAMNLKLFSQSL